VLTASSVCSRWREIIVKDNLLWKKLTMARWHVWNDPIWLQAPPWEAGWRSVHFERVRKDKEVLSLLGQFGKSRTQSEAIQRLTELGMDVWEKLISLINRWKRNPFHFLGLLHRAKICVQTLTELRLKKEWEALLPRISGVPEHEADWLPEDMEIEIGGGGGGGGGGEPGAHNQLQTPKRKQEGKRMEQVHIEEGAILIASWENSAELNMREKVLASLDEIARLVRCRLAKRLGREAPDGKETEDVAEEIILEEVNTILFGILGFRGNTNDYTNPNNSYIDQVLKKKTGIPVTLSLLYAAICRRLNVHLDMIGMPGHFLMRWTDKKGEPVFIDAFARGHHLDEEDCRQMCGNLGLHLFSPELLRPINHLAVYERMLGNLIGAYQRLSQPDKLLGIAKQMLILRGENSIDDLLTCGRLHILLDQFNEARVLIQRALDRSHNERHLEQARTLMLALERQVLQEERPPRSRPAPSATAHRLLYRVGQVINHIRQHYRGVIYGWDTVCCATPMWIQEMRVNELPRGTNQPFYSVLVDTRDKPGNWCTYVAQENIELHVEPTPIEHLQTGAFFSRFDYQNRRFVPNPDLQERYPDD